MTITDANGCELIYNEDVSTPTALALSTEGTDVSCSGDTDGSIDLTVSGGVPPFTYSWNNGSDQEDLNNLPAGDYDVVVTDSDDCTITAQVTINEPDNLEVFEGSIPTSVSCNGGSDGEAFMVVTGGTPGYTF